MDGCEEVKEAIRALDGIEAHLAAFRQRRQPSPKPLSPSQQEVERLMERFSAQTIDEMCTDLFEGSDEEAVPEESLPHRIKPRLVCHLSRALGRQLQLALVMLTPHEPPADDERNYELC